MPTEQPWWESEWTWKRNALVEPGTLARLKLVGTVPVTTEDGVSKEEMD